MPLLLYRVLAALPACTTTIIPVPVRLADRTVAVRGGPTVLRALAVSVAEHGVRIASRAPVVVAVEVRVYEWNKRDGDRLTVEQHRGVPRIAVAAQTPNRKSPTEQLA